MLKRSIEWYFGVPPADPGQGTAWNFDFHTPWTAWLPDWLLLILALSVLFYVGWICFRDARTESLRTRLSMIFVRLAAIAMILFFLSELTLAINRTGLPIVAILIDDSASMGLEDVLSNKRTQGRTKQLLSQAGLSKEATRLGLAKAILTRNNAKFLKQLQQLHKVRLYRFSETAIPIGEGEFVRGDEIDDVIPRLRDLEPTGNTTRPGPSLRKVIDDLRGTPPSAIILFSDGIASTAEADRLSGVAALAASRLIAIFTVGVGSEDPTRDVRLYDFIADEMAFVDDPISFSGKIEAHGFEGKTISIELKEVESDDVLKRIQVKAGPDGRPTEFEFSYTAPREGEFEFVVEAVPLAGETSPENNFQKKHVSVREQQIRVLLVESVPRYEFRYLKHVLEREKTIELSTVLQDADIDYAIEDQTALEHFPVDREALFRYDVVIFGDVDPALLSPKVFDNLRDFVREAAGGMILIAGPRHNPLSYQGTPLEVLLPVQLNGARVPAAEETIIEPFRPRLTIAGRKGTGIFRFAESEAESLRIWNNLPKLFWLFEAPELKPGAVTFAEHPTRTGTSGNIPVIAMQRFGAGKILFHATDDLCRWRMKDGDTYFGRYWIQAIRYLSRSKLLGSDRTAELTVDRTTYERGDTVNLRLRFFDERHAPAENDGVTVMLEHRKSAQRPLKLTRLVQAPNVFEGQLTRAEKGLYHAWVIKPPFRDAPPSVDFRVESSRKELQVRQLDRQELETTAKLTHGKFFSPLEALTLPNEIPPGQPVPLETQAPIPLWNRWELLLFFSALLLTEWLLRKRARLI